MWPIHRRWPRSIGPYGGAASVHTAPVISLRQGSNELDSSCSRERSSPVMLSAAKHLAADRDGPFASLRVTWCDESNCQGLCFTIEPCLKCIIGSLRLGRMQTQNHETRPPDSPCFCGLPLLK